MITNNYIIGNGSYIKDNEVYMDGKKLPPVPSEGKNITIINNKVYIDGYEFKNGQWKKTLKALWYKWF